jgi:RNA polymerase sigma factor (sigma-70 family)
MLNTNAMVTRELLQRMARAVERAIGRTNATNDIVQDACVRVLAKADSFDPEKGSFDSWALRIASNTARNWRKAAVNNGHASVAATGKEGEAGERKSRNLVDTIGAEPATHGAVVGPDGRSDIERTADAQALVEMLDCLDADERRFVMAINDGMTQTEAGALVGWSPATATRRRKAIAAKLAQYR